MSLPGLSRLLKTKIEIECSRLLSQRERVKIIVNLAKVIAFPLSCGSVKTMNFVFYLINFVLIGSVILV